MELRSRPEALDQVSVAIEIGFLGQPIERTTCSIDRRNRGLFQPNALNHDSQPLAGRYAASSQFVAYLASLDVIQNLSHRSKCSPAEVWGQRRLISFSTFQRRVAPLCEIREAKLAEPRLCRTNKGPRVRLLAAKHHVAAGGGERRTRRDG